MKRQERRGPEGDGSLSDASWTEEDRPESAQQPVARRQVQCPLASTAQDDQLLLEQQILRHHRSHTTGATELRGHDGQVQQGEQEVPHVRVSVGQAPRQDGWPASQARAVFLAPAGGESPDPPPVRVDAPADLGVAGADRLTVDSGGDHGAKNGRNTGGVSTGCRSRRAPAPIRVA
jgi:hypothetical protein